MFALAFSPDGDTTYSGGGDGRVAVWETAATSPKRIRTIEAHRGWVRAIGVSPDGTLLATGGNDRVVRLWETSSGSLIRELEGHRGHVYSLEFHPTGKTLLTGDLLGAIREWDLGTGKVIGGFEAKALRTYEASQQVDFCGVRGLAITPDGRSIAGGGLHKASYPSGRSTSRSRWSSIPRAAARANPADRWHPGRRDLAASLPGGRRSDGRLWRHQRRVPALLEIGPTRTTTASPCRTARDMDLHPDGLRTSPRPIMTVTFA